MKSSASTIMKKVFSALLTILKAKSMAVKGKANAMKTQLIIFWLLRNKHFLSAFSHKIHALISREKSRVMAKNKVLTKAMSDKLEEEAEEYPKVKHLLFDLEDEEDVLGDGMGTAMDSVLKSREDGSKDDLEKEIDQMANEFIRRFHNQMRMETQDSMEMYQEMLERSA